METLRYLIKGFPGAFGECHRWLTRVSRGGWTLLHSAPFPFLLCPGTPAWKAIKALRTLELESGG
jgi:hypothetical protein